MSVKRSVTAQNQQSMARLKSKLRIQLASYSITEKNIFRIGKKRWHSLMFETLVQDFAMRKKNPSSLESVWHRPNLTF